MTCRHQHFLLLLAPGLLSGLSCLSLSPGSVLDELPGMVLHKSQAACKNRNSSNADFASLTDFFASRVAWMMSVQYAMEWDMARPAAVFARSRCCSASLRQSDALFHLSGMDCSSMGRRRFIASVFVCSSPGNMACAALGIGNCADSGCKLSSATVFGDLSDRKK